MLRRFRVFSMPIPYFVTLLSISTVASQETASPSEAFGSPRGPGEPNAYVVREAGEYFDERTFLVYSSYCEDYVAEECGVVSLNCAERSPKVSFFGVESYQLAAILGNAAALLPKTEAEYFNSPRSGLPQAAFALLTDKGSVQVSDVHRLTTDFDFQYSFWTVSVETETAEFRSFIEGAKWLKIGILGKTVFVEDPRVLEGLHQFVSFCPE